VIIFHANSPVKINNEFPTENRKKLDMVRNDLFSNFKASIPEPRQVERPFQATREESKHSDDSGPISITTSANFYDSSAYK
jgi:hypothetical protein